MFDNVLNILDFVSGNVWRKKWYFHKFNAALCSGHGGIRTPDICNVHPFKFLSKFVRVNAPLLWAYLDLNQGPYECESYALAS